MGNKNDEDHYDILIIGGGVSGTALLYTLARYATGSIALVEKYGAVGLVNTNARNNSQTLHTGEIESNYGMDKVLQVKPASLMVAQYAKSLAAGLRSKILFPTPKMLLAVGEQEVRELRERYEDLRGMFPNLRKLERERIASVEPMIVKGRAPREQILALYTEDGYAVDYEMLARSFVDEAKKLAERNKPFDYAHGKRKIDVHLNADVSEIVHSYGGFTVYLKNGMKISARVVVSDADSYSLLFAKRLGLGREFSLIPVAGSFYFSNKMLNGKCYTMQDPQLPFAAVHGDPDVRVPGKTRWGPTARFFPVLEARNWKTSLDYFAVSGLQRWQTWISFITILLEPMRLYYLLRNLLYEIPFAGNWFYAREVRKIIPSIRSRDISRAQGFGGMRLQRVNTKTRELLLGEGKITAKNIIFNMSPSPGASVCLYNAMRDAERIAEFFSADEYSFDKKRMMEDLCAEEKLSETISDVSLEETYPS